MSAKRDRQLRERVKRVVRTPDRLARQLNRVHLGCHRGQHGFALGTRHILADASVNADAEREMANGSSGDVEPARDRPVTLVEVGRCEHAEDLGPRQNLDATNFGVNARRATEGVHRRGVA